MQGNAGDTGSILSLGQEDILEEKKTSHWSILAWEIPWTKEPGGLQSVGQQRFGHDWATEHSPKLSLTIHLCCSSGFGPSSCLFYTLNTLSRKISHMSIVSRYSCLLSCLSHVWLFAILWTVAHQVPLSKGFSRQEHWSGMPCPSLKMLLLLLLLSRFSRVWLCATP